MVGMGGGGIYMYIEKNAVKSASGRKGVFKLGWLLGCLCCSLLCLVIS